MQDIKKNVLLGTMAATLVISGGGTALAEEAPQGASDASSASTKADAASGVAPSVNEAEASQGEFAYDQTAITPNSIIKDVFQRATAALCNATDDFAAGNPLEWKITVSGDVDQAFTLPVDELASESSVQQVMTCTCGGNPADGKAIITADVKGIPVSYLLDRAEARSGVNTVTFVSSDGTELAIPIAYAVGRHGVISYEINDEDLSASVGGNNQLWMTRTSANYFVRDIVEVRVTSEATPPENPGEGMEYPNSPNVGILSAEIG